VSWRDGRTTGGRWGTTLRIETRSFNGSAQASRTAGAEALQLRALVAGFLHDDKVRGHLLEESDGSRTVWLHPCFDAKPAPLP